MKILIVEDDVLLQGGLSQALSSQGYAVDCASSAAEADALLHSAQYSLIVLDLGLPDRDGGDLLRQWRRAGVDLPVLILTARDALDQRVEGLQLGADDYLCKPFALTEVAARLQALIRRRHGQLQPELRHGNVIMQPASHSVTRDGELVPLKSRELALLELFLRHPGRVLTRAQLEEKLYSWDADVSSNAVEVHIHHLRKKLGASFIRTVHGVGYMLGEPQ